MASSPLRRRVPVQLRQNWKPLTAGVAVLGVALTVFGDVTIRPYSTSANAATAEELITENIVGTTDLFDPTVAHDITLTYDEDAYDRMLDAYFSDGEKDWMEADITIDGTTIQSVGVRLKGNSTLSSLTDGRDGSATQGETAPGGMGGVEPPGGMQPSESTGLPEGVPFPGGMEPPDGIELPDGMEPPDGIELPDGMERPDGAAPDDQQEPGAWVAGGGGGTLLSTDSPETLPLLVSFSELAPGRAYQGRTELSIRPAGTSYTTALNEALALELTAQSGQATQGYTFVSYTVNDRSTTTRLVIENPDQSYAQRVLDGDGVLYKLLSTSEFTYQGEDQTEYEDDFDQVNLVGSQDLQPVISFLRWLDSATDEEFVDELDAWVDVESFARYLATQEVLDNFDSMSGPGRNAYLYYDLSTRLITVISWDLNLAFGGMPGGGGIPGGGLPGGGMMPDGGTMPRGQVPGGMMPRGEAPGGQPRGGSVPDGDVPDGVMPDGLMPGGDGLGDGLDGRGGPGGMGAANALVTRFESAPEFSSLAEQAVADLEAEWIDSGLAAQVLDGIAARVPATAGVSQAVIDTEAESLRSTLASQDSTAQASPGQ